MNYHFHVNVAIIVGLLTVQVVDRTIYTLVLKLRRTLQTRRFSKLRKIFDLLRSRFRSVARSDGHVRRPTIDLSQTMSSDYAKAKPDKWSVYSSMMLTIIALQLLLQFVELRDVKFPNG